MRKASTEPKPALPADDADGGTASAQAPADLRITHSQNRRHTVLAPGHADGLPSVAASAPPIAGTALSKLAGRRGRCGVRARNGQEHESSRSQRGPSGGRVLEHGLAAAAISCRCPCYSRPPAVVTLITRCAAGPDKPG